MANSDHRAMSALSEAELMALDLLDCGWEPGVIEDAFNLEAGSVRDAIEKAAAEATRAGLH